MDLARRLDPAFAALIGSHRLEELEANEHTVIGLRPDSTIAYRNRAWERFARDNGAPELTWWNGTPILEVFHPEVRGVYRALFERVRDSQAPEDHTYQCSSPSAYREFRLRVLPLEQRHLLLVHHLVVDRPHHWEAHAGGPQYIAADGFIHQCCHCRRTRRPHAPQTWDWVPQYLDRTLDNVSHGLCTDCFRHYHPMAAARRDASRDSSP
jgi:hypothetical protein